MQYRALPLLALASLAALAACGDNNSNDVTGLGNTATVRFVNATGNSSISVANAGVIGSNSSLFFGTGSSCMTVDASNPNLTFTNTATGNMITGFTPAFATNGNYTVVAYDDASGNTQFATLDNSYSATSGQAGLRVFNAASGSGDVVLNSGGNALNSGATTAFGSGGTFFSTPTTTSDYTFNTGIGTNTIADAGNLALTAGQNGTIILGPAAAGSTTMRAFYTPGC